MNGISWQSQCCLETWIGCENLLATFSKDAGGSLEHVMKTVDECAHICMETWQALKSRSVEARKLVLLCIGICEECADVCEQSSLLQVKQCAKACRRCANSFTQLALATAYN